MANRPSADADDGSGSPRPSASSAVAVAPSAPLAITTWLGSRSASRRDSELSTPQAAVASATASSPHNCRPPPRCWSSTSTMAPASSSAIAVQTRRSIVSWYRRQASTAVNSASSVSISDALVPLVRCRPQASATGPMAAPKAAIASSRGRSARISRASRCAGRRDNAPTMAAPAYNSAAVLQRTHAFAGALQQRRADAEQRGSQQRE